MKQGDTQYTAEAKRIAKERGLRVTFFTDENLSIRQSNGEFASVRGYITGNRVFIRADHPLYTADQIMRHEAGHDMIAKGEVDPNTVRDRIAKSYGKQQVVQLSQMYADAYTGTGMTAEEIWEEVICDSLGDMNIFAGKVEEDAAGAYLSFTKDATQANTVESRQERGPPDEKMSREVFPPYNESKSDANEQATRWAHRGDVENGDQRLFSYRGSWYLVEADKKADLGYRIVDIVPNGLVDNYQKEIEEYGRVGEKQSLSESVGGIDILNQRSGSDGDRKSSAPFVQAKYKGENRSVQQLGKVQNGRRYASGDRAGNLQSGSTDSAGDSVTADRFAVSDETKSFLQSHAKAQRLKRLQSRLKSGKLSAEQKNLVRQEIKTLRNELNKASGKLSRDLPIETRKEHNRAALEHFGSTYKWDETGYILLDGTRLDFSGKHNGAPGGYRTVDHRDITDALGVGYGGDGYSDGMVQFMAEGNIRVMPETDGINLSVAPTKEQERMIDMFVTRKRGEIMLDLDDTNGNTLASLEYPRGTKASRVISDIRRYFEEGTVPQLSETAQFHYSMEPTSEFKGGGEETRSSISDKIREEVRIQLARMGKEYGWIPAGESPYREAQVPRRTEWRNRNERCA